MSSRGTPECLPRVDLFLGEFSRQGSILRTRLTSRVFKPLTDTSPLFRQERL